MSSGMRFLPAASTAADKFESFFDVYLIIGTLLFVATLGACFYFAIKYKRKTDNDPTPYIAGNYLVEFLSIFLISLWAAVFFLWGWHDYKEMLVPKQDEYEIYSDGRFVKGKFNKYENQKMIKVTLSNGHVIKMSQQHLNYVLKL